MGEQHKENENDGTHWSRLGNIGADSIEANLILKVN